MTPRKIILRTTDYELVAAFESNVVDHMAMPPDVMFFGQETYSFTTMSSDHITYVKSFAFALQEGITARRLSEAETSHIRPIDPSCVDCATMEGRPEAYPTHDSR